MKRASAKPKMKPTPEGGERFKPLGQKKKIALPASEYAYVTDDHEVICRLECKQCQRSKIKPDTTRWFFILQGNGRINELTIHAAQERLLQKLRNGLVVDLRYDAALLSERRLAADLVV